MYGVVVPCPNCAAWRSVAPRSASEKHDESGMGFLGGFEIAVNDALFGRSLEPLRYLPRDRQRLVNRDRSLCDALRHGICDQSPPNGAGGFNFRNGRQL